MALTFLNMQSIGFAMRGATEEETTKRLIQKMAHNNHKIADTRAQLKAAQAKTDEAFAQSQKTVKKEADAPPPKKTGNKKIVTFKLD